MSRKDFAGFRKEKTYVRRIVNEFSNATDLMRSFGSLKGKVWKEIRIWDLAFLPPHF